MVYVEQKDNYTYYYDVILDKEKLHKLLDKLEEFSYVTHSKGIMPGDGSLMPNRLLTRRIAGRLSSRFNGTNQELIIDSIVIKKNDSNVIEYEYSYRKKPDLYYYILLLMGEGNIEDYYFMFKEAFPNIGAVEALVDKGQLLIQLLFDYSYSDEFTKNDYYDVNELRNIYEKTLLNIKFNMTERKEKIFGCFPIDGKTIKEAYDKLTLKNNKNN